MDDNLIWAWIATFAALAVFIAWDQHRQTRQYERDQARGKAPPADYTTPAARKPATSVSP